MVFESSYMVPRLWRGKEGGGMNHNKYHRPGMRATRAEKARHQKALANSAENVLVAIWLIVLGATLIIGILG